MSQVSAQGSAHGAGASAAHGIALSPEQQQVIDHRAGDLQVIACAGSGKTESISRRVADLIAEGAAPSSVVAFTFTERAAAELNNRIIQRVAERMGSAFRDRLGPMFVGTIHAYCFRLLQDHVPRYGSYDILDENRHAALLSRDYHALGLSKLGAKHWQPIRDFSKALDVIGNELISIDQFGDTPLAKCVATWRALLERYHFLTYATLISAAVEALEDPAIHAGVCGPLRHLLVDEYQDINPAQERLIELLAQAPVQLTVVGDDDQSIYQWRGSDVRNILTFTRRRQPVATVQLDTNRRSRPRIVETANAFAASIPSRLPKRMEAVRPGGAAELTCFAADTDEDEANQVADTIQVLHRRGFSYRDIAVLFRSVRTAAPPFLAALEARNIPFSCGGRTGLFMQPEIALFGELFAWFVDGDWRDHRWAEPSKPGLDDLVRGLSRHFAIDAPNGELPGLRKYLEDWRAFQLRAIRPVSLVDDFYKLLARLGADRIDVDSQLGSARFGAFARFSEILADFEHVHRRGGFVTEEGRRVFRAGRDRGKPYFQALHNYLLHWARDAYEDFAGEAHADLDAVDVLTVHQAKGLEWPIVFLPSLVKGRFPSQRAGHEQDWLLPESVFPAATRSRYEGGDGKERRLFYVALTRARDALYLSCFRRKARNFEPSPYLVELAGEEIPERATLPLPDAPKAEAPREPPPVEVPFSDLARVDECGYSYRLGTVFGFQQALAPELGYGKALHHVLRQLAEHVGAGGAVPDDDGLDRLVDDEFYVPFATPASYANMRRAAVRLVRRYVEDYAADLHRIWAVERPFALHFDEGIVSGRADVILDVAEGDESGRLAVVDYKVANDPEREGRYRLQLAVYSAAGRGEGLTVDAAWLHELRDGVRTAVDVSADATGAASAKVRELLARTRTARLDACPAEALCTRCDFHRVCAQSASEAR